MSGRLIIRYSDGGRVTEIDRPVGPPWQTYAEARPNRDDLAEALASATAEMLDAAHPKGDQQ
jgi:hypothetical protein